MKMQDYQKRVIEEKAELDKKISKLGNFFDSEIFSGLRNHEKTLMHIQYASMLTYSATLEKRMQCFKSDDYRSNYIRSRSENQ